MLNNNSANPLISKKQEYLNMLYQILEMPNGNEKLERFTKLYTAYRKFCYQYGLATYDLELCDKTKTLFIIESRPIEYVIDNDKKQAALYHLKSVLENRKNGIPDGISMEEANLILSMIVQNARVGLSTGNKDFFEDSLQGSCGFSQAITTFPLLELGVPVTINNASSLPDCKSRHAFATCTLPIKDGNQIYEKQFLIDATYRQFFLAIGCNEGKFFEGDSRFKNQDGPKAGYYVCQTSKGISFATELLKKGYVELTEENARIYGSGFSMETICLSIPVEERERIASHSGKEYIDAINDKTLQEDLDYTREELMDWGCNVSLDNPIGRIKRVPAKDISVNNRGFV